MHLDSQVLPLRPGWLAAKFSHKMFHDTKELSNPQAWGSGRAKLSSCLAKRHASLNVKNHKLLLLLMNESSGVPNLMIAYSHTLPWEMGRVSVG